MINLITTNQQLDEFCQNLEQQDFITVDLEFHREKTYYAQLGLIQVGAKGFDAIIDPLSKDIDLARFFVVLDNPKIVKVFHSCRQDIEILYQKAGFIPHPLFDTQIAAQICGFGSFSSYESLVNAILGIELDKSSRLTNWCVRPLSEKQLSYAISDVTHLVHIYEFMRDQIAQTHREHWLDEEMQPLLKIETYENDPMKAWLKLRQHSHNRKYLTVLRELAAWRERRAQLKNVPKQNIIKDECLLNVAAEMPHSVEELLQIRNMRADVAKGKLGAEILDVIQKVEQMPHSDYAKLPPEKRIVCNANLYELLKLLLNLIAQDEKCVPHIIASDDELKLFSAHKDLGLNMLKGWRREVFGQRALTLREGKLLIKYNTDEQKIEFIEDKS